MVAVCGDYQPAAECHTAVKEALRKITGEP
jgi:hypothetical protein